MEICGKLAAAFSGAQDREGTIRACSACSGDYEDPDRTAPAEHEEETQKLEPSRQDIREDLTGNADPAGLAGLE